MQIIDSHTGGEPTRTIVSGIDLPIGATATRDYLAQNADWIRTILINEPRGFDAIVGACLCQPEDESCVTGVVFFNNLSYLHSCLHGTIGIVQTLVHLNRIQPGDHRIETPIGIITASLADDQTVTVKNVPSYRFAESITVDVPNHGPITGDIAWGGNWFFLISDQGPAIQQENIPALTEFTSAVRQALHAQNITGADEGEIDHIESFASPPPGLEADSQNFVLCPGSAYDRSPCGTGTSAKLACLAANRQLSEGQTWHQASIIGTIFKGSFQSLPNSEKITPIISGRAHITAETTVVIDEDDPFKHGIPDS